jgi:hypothetical protein
VNVSVIAARQLVGFVVPARHIEPLLRRAKLPIATTLSVYQARAMVAQQALTHESSILDPGGEAEASQSILGFEIPTRVGRAFECSTTGASEVPQRMQVETIRCAARAGVLLQADLEVGQIQFQHRVISATDLHPLQFTQRVNGLAADYPWAGSDRNVARYACQNALVSLDGFDARISTCARQYRLFAGLYDIAVTITSVHDTQRALVTHVDLRGVGFEPGMQFLRRFLGAMRWKP